MSQTAMAEAFSAKGITPNEAAFNLAVAKYQNRGGTYERARAMLDAAYGLGSEGLTASARDGLTDVADAPGEAGQSPHDVGSVQRQPASPTERSAGRVAIADKASAPVPVAAHQRQHPGHARRGAEAIAAIQPTMAKAAFYTIRLDDGRTIAEVRWNEAVSLAQRHSRNARILIAAHNYAIPADPSTRLGEMVPEGEQRSIVSIVERINAH